MGARRIGFAGALVLISFLSPAAAIGQTPCRFVFGFADLAARLGPPTIGTCLEDQRTVTGPQTFNLSDSLRLELPTGTAVQRTTTGTLAWFPQTNATKFYDSSGEWELTLNEVTFSRWQGASVDTPPPPTAVPSSVQAKRDADSACFRIYSAAIIPTVYSSPAEQERVKSEATAGNYLCGQAADRDEVKGVECFRQAWDAAKGMERVFQGSGQKVYDERYARCVGR